MVLSEKHFGKTLQLFGHKIQEDCIVLHNNFKGFEFSELYETKNHKWSQNHHFSKTK